MHEFWLPVNLAAGIMGQVNRSYRGKAAGICYEVWCSRISAVKTERDIAKVSFDRAVSEMRPDVRITKDNIAAFAELRRTN
jgi:hypothetical protein